MKKFEIVKVTFEGYIAINRDLQTVRDELYTKLDDKIVMYCTDNAFGLTETKINLEIQE